MSLDDVGDPGGTPVVYLHGGGDSRLSRHPDDSIAAGLGIRLLAVDRCGPARRYRSLRAWAEELAGALPVERFGVVGWSAGGPHALALAAVAPERVARVALVGSMPPPDLVSLLAPDV
ncbi:MAG TPA: alpha/beta fold hydrolase, partial [Minicystis sp.]|nr:alpha/beta fold hydrolase [Minicystis sp.]